MLCSTCGSLLRKVGFLGMLKSADVAHLLGTIRRKTDISATCSTNTLGVLGRRFFCTSALIAGAKLSVSIPGTSRFHESVISENEKKKPRDGIAMAG